MAQQSAIEWTESTWNPVTGCTKISPGCENCYAERMALRLQAMGQPNYANGFELTMQRRMLELPLRWRQPQTIFVNSMSDLFHRGVTTEYILEVFGVMNRASRHRYQVLTKRSQRLERLSPQLPWQRHIWMGVSVESREYTFRIDHLRNTGAHVKFLSLEPLLRPLRRLNLRGIDWVIVGGESGPYAREMKPEWVLDIRDQCLAAEVPFFFKQWGGKRKTVNGRRLDGEEWNQMPAAVAA
ncbi:MAG TPA: phage Gp37/Gp68 family protein [Pyrinomonadaceae bacterium]|jgi:protein gp37|nr:phage Gp37/Gp68 family protein [Pyrinomonadaceae bacterium]